MSRNAGFTLIEVLIAMVVLAVGLLGLAGLQATSLRNSQSAYNRSQATQLTYDLADRMRANIPGVATYTVISPLSDAEAKPNCLNATGCTPQDMAENDLFEWNESVATALPSVSASTITVTADGMFTISLQWDDNKNGDDTDDHSFDTSFRL